MRTRNVRPVIVSVGNIRKAIKLFNSQYKENVERGTVGVMGVERSGANVGEIDKESVRRQDIRAAISEAETVLEKITDNGDVLVSPNDRNIALLQSFVARKGIDVKKTEQSDSGHNIVKFADEDWVNWADAFVRWVCSIQKHTWIEPDADPGTLPPNARITMLGDWGTGLYGAPDCARSIERSINSTNAPHMILHLGDVYYSGTPDEVVHRFLDLFPKTNDNIIRRALNSNHEMYSGGFGYFDNILPAFNQSASCFAFENDNWIFIGLDTGFEDNDINENQLDWLSSLMDRADRTRKKVVLTSHHQAFSVLDWQNSTLVEKLEPWLRKSKIFAWYWGHEHRCVLYDKHPVWNMYGACIGHSGFPYHRGPYGNHSLFLKNHDGSTWLKIPSENHPNTICLDGPNNYLPAGQSNNYGPNGYASILLKDDKIIETIYAANGIQLYERTLG